MVSQSRFRLLSDKGQFAPTDAAGNITKIVQLTGQFYDSTVSLTAT